MELLAFVTPPPYIYQKVMVGATTLLNLKMMISQNITQNLPVTVEDIDTEEKIIGLGVYIVNVITTRQGKKLVVGAFIKIPR